MRTLTALVQTAASRLAEDEGSEIFEKGLVIGVSGAGIAIALPLFKTGFEALGNGATSFIDTALGLFG